jgi:hypothetical protein
MLQTSVNHTMRKHNVNETQATAIYNYKREALAFIGSKFKGVYIGGEKWKNPRLEVLSLIASPLPKTKNAFSGLLSLPLTHNPNPGSKLFCLESPLLIKRSMTFRGMEKS